MYWKHSNPNCNGNRRDKEALMTTCTKKYQWQDHQNKHKGRLSVCGILLLQRKPKLGRTKPSTGPHAARGPWVGHSCTRQYDNSIYLHWCSLSCKVLHSVYRITYRPCQKLAVQLPKRWRHDGKNDSRKTKQNIFLVGFSVGWFL